MLLPVKPGQPLDLKISLLMGQAFRWKPDKGSDWFSGVVQGQFIQVRQGDAGILEFRGQPGPDAAIANILKDYLRLEENITAIYTDLSRKDGRIAELIAKYPGLRILRQEPWECLVAYLCSANNNVGRISEMVEQISEKFGAPIPLDGVTRYAFPTPQQLRQAGVVELESLGLGLNRHIKIYQAAGEVADGSLDLKALRQAPYAQAREQLKKRYGVGDKIADCVLLFSLDKDQAFPIDRHIGRALVKHCFPHLPDTQLRTLQVQGQKRFGRYAGYAGQFLFHGERLNGK